MRAGRPQYPGAARSGEVRRLGSDHQALPLSLAGSGGTPEGFWGRGSGGAESAWKAWGSDIL